MKWPADQKLSGKCFRVSKNSAVTKTMGKICIVGWPVVSEGLEISFRVPTVSEERKRFIKCKASSQISGFAPYQRRENDLSNAKLARKPLFVVTQLLSENMSLNEL